MFKKIFKLLSTNIQFNQTVWLSILLITWIEFYWLNIWYIEVFSIFTTVILLDFLLIKYETWKIVFPYSWVNAWFWISFFLRSDDLILFIFAWFVAIFSKKVFTTLIWDKRRHFFNPSNLGVFTTLVLFPYLAWTNPLQWWQWVDTSIYFIAIVLIFLASFNIEYRLKSILNFSLLDIIFWLLITHILFFYFFTNETIEWAYLFFNWSFWIFLFFMITDPKTIPTTREARVFFWIFVSLLFYILQYFINENYSLLASLFIMTMFLPIIWRYEFNLKNKNKLSKRFRNISQLRFLLLTIFFSMLLFLCWLITNYWVPDLVFNNRCNQLFCRNF